MSLRDALWEAITGSPSFATPDNTRGMIGRLIREIGSKRAVARALGVSDSTVRRWEAGTRPKDSGRIVEAYRRQLLPATRETTLRSGKITLEFQQARRGGSGTRTRLVDQTGLDLAPGTMGAVVSAYLAGDDDAAVRLFHDGIQDRIYSDAIQVEDDYEPDSEVYALY